MAARRVVVDTGRPAPVDVCPGCGASLAWVRKEDLEQVAFAWRCAPGRQPRTFRLGCRDCKRLALVYETRSGTLAFVSDQEDALRSTREQAREQAAALARVDDRDRDS